MGGGSQWVLWMARVKNVRTNGWGVFEWALRKGNTYKVYRSKVKNLRR